MNAGEKLNNRTFLQLDRDFRHIMRAVEKDTRVSTLINFPGLNLLLTTLTGQLVHCQNTLDEYMKEKRSIFPRFFFLNDDDLLEMLGQTKITSQNREYVLQAHIKKLFPGTIGVNLGPEAVCITALKGENEEKLTLDTPVDIDAPIETWLSQLEEQMRQSLHTCIRQCIAKYEMQNSAILQYPTQVMCLVRNILFTKNVEKAITVRNVHTMKNELNEELNKYLKIGIQESENNLDKYKLQSIVLQSYHHLEILNELLNNRISSVDHWYWQKQLRYYIDQNSIYACIGLAKLPYTFEYFGLNSSSLVQTKLTDQCFLVLTQASHMGMAGNPFGPAGTGKTESVKALGRLLGRLVLVFNCDEGMDTVTMGRLLSGLALSGAWGCFDEFNRLEEKTLSDVAQQFSSILEAIGCKIQTTTAILNNKEVQVSTGCGVFVTMNPAGGSYGGRRILPEALNRLLRPCAMWHPCANHIASALLASHGYSNSSQLADKLVICFDMAKSLLTDNHHYDWGLRALKTIIGSCGTNIRDVVLDTKNFPDEHKQMSLIVQAIKQNTLSKLSYDDSKRFEEILNIVFPGINIYNNTSDKLYDALKESYEAQNLVVNENQIRKCIELYDQLKQRMGVVLVGPPGSGKSTLYKLLKSALIKMGNNIVHHIICPKALDRNDLLGYIENDTRQWCDGVISTISQNVTNQPSDMWSWIICDGDIDPEWIESLNSVLDDNRLLTLPSGWRIQFGNNVNFIFETHDLTNASPATITRLGIILLSDEECCYEEVIQSWIKYSNNYENWTPPTITLLQDLLKKALDWVKINSNDIIISYNRIPLIKQILTFLNAEDRGKSIEELIANALMKGLSSIIKPKLFNDVVEQISQWTGVSSHALIWKNDSDENHDSLGSMTMETSLLHFSKRVSKLFNLAKTLIDSNQHFMIFGPPASGKSMIIDHLLKDNRSSTIINLQCTPIFDIQHVIQVLKQKSALTSEGGKSGGQLILVIKSLQRASTDKWNTSIFQSFILQLVHHGGFWHKSDGIKWFGLRPFVLIITATIENSDLKISQRLSNSLRIANLIDPDENEISDICRIYLCKTLEKLDLKSEDSKKLSEFDSKMLTFYNNIKQTFTSELHYRWTTKDLTKWCHAIILYKISDYSTACQAICEESKYIFKNRLITANEKIAFDSLSQKILGVHTIKDQIFIPKMNSNGLKMELIDNEQWILHINKLMNICNNEMENGNDIFGESGAEQCIELRNLIAQVGRVLNGITNSVVLVGTAGVGRRAAARIAAERISAKNIIISTPSQFFAQLKNILTSSGCDCNSTILILAEGATSDKNVLGVVEALLADGNDTNAISLPFYSQEIDTLISQMKTNNNEPKTIKTFIKNVKTNLGMVILLDTKQNNLKELFTTNPLLYQRSQFTWIENWSEASMKEIPAQLFRKLHSNISGSEKHINDIYMEKLHEIHLMAEKDDLSTPYRYMLFLKTYFNIHNKKKQLLEEKVLKLQSGVSALTKAQNEVAVLKADSAQQQTVLSEKQLLATEALNQIGLTMQSATVHKQELEILKQNTERENIKLQERKSDIEMELSEVEPIIQEARAAVGDIKPESLSEVRSLRAPPDPVRDVLEGVLRLMGIGDTSWHSMKLFLSKRGIKDEIRNFNAANITPESLVAVEKLLLSREASFSEKTAKRASLACAPLAAWVLANVKYANVLKKIAPLETEQRILSRNLAKAETKIITLSGNLNTVDERVAALKLQLNTYTKEATEVEIRLSSVLDTVNKAENLVHKLSNEFIRWNENLKNLIQENAELTINALLAAGFIIYLSNENTEKQINILKKWCGIFSISTVFPVKNFFLAYDEEIKWIDYGLPSDSNALHNAIIINELLEDPKSGLVPLVIDPNDGGFNWLSQRLKNIPNDVVTQHDPKFNTILQHAVRFGKILIIKELSYIDDNWSSLLRGQISSALIGINSISQSFRLILFSRDSTLLSKMSSFHKSLISIVNFTPQHQGLTDQLIYCAVKQEEPELQIKKIEINNKKSNLQIQQEKLEDQLLNQLSSGDLLHNSTLLESLESTQEASREISESLISAAEVMETINQQCQLYQPLATRAAAACIAIHSLSNQYPLISLSLQTVTKIFLKILMKYKGRDKNDETISRNIVVALLERVLVALNKEEHSSVLIYLIHLIYPDQITQQEWEIFISNPENYINEHSDVQTLKEIPKWITPDRASYIYILQNYLSELYNTLGLENESLWKKFITTGDWDSIPSNIKLTPFQKLLIIWALKPLKLNVSFAKAISHILGVDQLFPSGDLISTVENWGSPEQPILVIGSTGTDPVDQIKARAANVVGINNYKQIWLSERDSMDTSTLMHDAIQWAMKSGGWLVLSASAGNFSENDFIQTLTEYQSLSESVDSHVRIWIVAENTTIPYRISTICVNVIMEAPSGIKNNLLRTLTIWGPYQGASPNNKNNTDPKKVRLEFSLALAHSVIQERCAYIPQGWRHNYGFSWGDIEASLVAIRSLGRTEAGGLCVSLYSGRIYCEQDMLLLSAILEKHFDESVIGHAWKPLGMDLSLPMTGKLQDYIGILTNFPSYDGPNLLSLPHNIQSAQEQLKGSNSIAHLRFLIYGDTSQEFNKKILKKKLAPYLTLWKKLNNSSDSLIKSQIGDFKNESEWSGMKALAVCEWEAAVIGVKQIHADFVALHSISTQNDTHLYKLAINIIADKTPQPWMNHWKGGPPSATAFIIGFCERAAAARKRILSYEEIKTKPVVSLSSLLKPSCVLNALLWESAKHLSKPPEKLKAVFKWDDKDTDYSSRKSVFTDLWIEGAVWEAGRLQPCRVDTPFQTKAPPISIQFFPIDNLTEYVDKNQIEIPIYASTERKDIVFKVSAPSGDQYNKNQWLLNSTALIISQNNQS